jgi:hypothetical protein
MIRRSAIIAVELGLGLAAASLVGAGLLAWRLAQGPIELAPLKAQLERSMSEARDGRAVSIDRVDLVWNVASRALELRAQDVALLDAQGHVQSQAGEVAVGLDPLMLLVGRVAVSRAAFVGGELSVVFAHDGTARVAVGPPGSAPDFVIPAPPPNETMQQRANRILDGFALVLRPVGAGGRLRTLSVRDAQLTIVDERRDGRITAQTAAVELVRDRNALRLSVSADLDGPRGPAPFRLQLTTDPQFAAGDVDLSIEGVRPRLLLPPGALGPLSGLDAPTDATLSASLNRQTGLTRLEGHLALGAGEAEFAGGRFALTGAEMSGSYNDDDDVLELQRLSIDGARTAIDGTIRIRDASRLLMATGGEPAAFTVEFPNARIDMPGVLAAPVEISATRITGAISVSDRAVTLQSTRIGVGEAVINATGRLSWAQVASGAWRPGLALEGTIDGAVDPRTVLSFWPLHLGEGAREYLDRSLLGGRITETAFRIGIRPEQVGAALPNEAVDVRFNFADAQVRFIETMTPLTAASGHGRLQGNMFELTLDQGQVGAVSVGAGSVTLPRLSPRGAVATIGFRGHGRAREVLRLLQEEPIALGDRLPVDMDTVTGDGSFEVQLRRPMLKDVPIEDLRYTVAGTFTGVGARARDRDVVLANWALNVSGNEQAIRLQGPLLVNASPLTVDWTESLRRDDATPSRFLLTGDFDALDLDRLGFGTSHFAQGPIGVEVRALGRGFDVDTGTVGLELSRASLTLPGRLWDKPAGQPARGSFRVDRAADGLMLSDIELTGPNVAISGGEATFGSANVLNAAAFPRVRVGDTIDVAMSATRRPDQVLAVTLRGAAFDAVRYLDAGAEPAPAAAPEPAPEPAAVPRLLPASAAVPQTSTPQRYAIAMDVARLRMRGDVDLHNATVAATLRDDILVSLTAAALTAGGAPVRLAMGPRASDPSGGVSFSTGDAGVALTALTGASNVQGGTATATGRWVPGRVMNADFSLAMRDFSVVDVPAMAQLLSTVASLQGLADTLNGEGITISSLEAPLALRGDQLQIGESRAAGPALGFTASGAFNMRTGEIDLDGVVVPSYGLNSMWGNLPLVGGLLVSRRGEGVVGITFSMDGPIEKARVGVNPLSALAPGIFRRIFEPFTPRDLRAPPRRVAP